MIFQILNFLIMLMLICQFSYKTCPRLLWPYCYVKFRKCIGIVNCQKHRTNMISKQNTQNMTKMKVFVSIIKIASANNVSMPTNETLHCVATCSGKPASVNHIAR